VHAGTGQGQPGLAPALHRGDQEVAKRPVRWYPWIVTVPNRIPATDPDFSGSFTPVAAKADQINQSGHPKGMGVLTWFG